MESTFEQRLRSAARAAWWTVLVALAVILVQWGLFVYVSTHQPRWLLGLWGSDMSWAELKDRWLDAFVAMRMLLFFLALGAVWTSIWSAGLRRRIRAERREPMITDAALSGAR